MAPAKQCVGHAGTGDLLVSTELGLCSALSMYHLDPLGLVPLISSILPRMKLRLRVRQFAEGSAEAEFRFVFHHSDTGFPGFVNSALVLEQMTGSEE